jgi:hypothetical protein
MMSGIRKIKKKLWEELIAYFSVQDQVNLRPTVSRPVCLGVGTHLEPMTRFLFPIWWVRVSWCGHPLWREEMSVIYLYNCFWVLQEQSISGPSTVELTTIFCCLIWESPNQEGQVLVFISTRNRVAQLYPFALGSILSPLTTSGAKVKVFYSVSTRVLLSFQYILSLCYVDDRTENVHQFYCCRKCIPCRRNVFT